MTFFDLLPTFDRECALITAGMMKTAYAAAPGKSQSKAMEKVEKHLISDSKDWGQFEKDMKGKKFRQAVAAHPFSDEKLKAYVKANGEYQTSKDVAGVVPSSSSSRLYRIKRIGADKRLACGCKDWQYKHSHGGGDCKHIAELAQGLKEKVSASHLNYIARGVALARTMEKAKKEQEKGHTMKENVKRLRAGAPLAPVQR